MMRAVIIISIAFILTEGLRAQVNLIPNSGFEIYDTCPYSQSQITFATGWFNSNYGTSDYYNACYDTITMVNVDVPVNMIGIQSAHSGNAYAGFMTMFYNMNISTMEDDRKEYVEIELSEPLSSCGHYHLEFYVSLAEGSGKAFDKVGAYFTPDSLIQNDGLHVMAQPQIQSPNGLFLDDTSGWMQISGDFTARGGERFLSIGFFSEAADESIETLGWSNGGYYYIDDVSLTLHDSLSNSSCFVLEAPNVFTPDGNGINDFFVVNGQGVDSYTCKIYDRWGFEVFSGNNTDDVWDGKDKNGNGCNDGVYFYIINARDFGGIEHELKGFVHLFR